MTKKQKTPENQSNNTQLSSVDFVNKLAIVDLSVAAVSLGLELLSNTGDVIKETVETIDSLIP